jgi:glutaredoxin
MQHTSSFEQHLTPLPMSQGRWLPSLALACATLALLPAVAQAQAVYRIVGPDGRVTFSDKPPVTATQVTPQSSVGSESAGNGAVLPYELRQVVGKYPVTLYTSKDCAPCDSGRSLLRSRGVPFAEKTVSTAEDSEALVRLSGVNTLPLLTLGGQQIKGYSDAEWAQYLGAAGYPEKSRLPSGYRNPPPSPLVAVKAPTPSEQKASDPGATANQPTAPVRPKVDPANPAGIQF